MYGVGLGEEDTNEQMSTRHRCRDLLRSSVWRPCLITWCPCSGHRREGGRERNGLPGWLFVWGWGWGGGDGGNTCDAGTAGEGSGSWAVLELSGTTWDPRGVDGDALDCASTDRPCFVMALSLIFFLTPKIIKTKQKKNAAIHECLFWVDEVSSKHLKVSQLSFNTVEHSVSLSVLILTFPSKIVKWKWKKFASWQQYFLKKEKFLVTVCTYIAAWPAGLHAKHRCPELSWRCAWDVPICYTLSYWLICV